MPMCTYLGQDQRTQPTTNDELNNLLSKVREATGSDWRIGEFITEQFRLFCSKKVSKSYSLYHHISGSEFQIINIPTDSGAVASFLYGVLAGISSQRQ